MLTVRSRRQLISRVAAVVLLIASLLLTSKDAKADPGIQPAEINPIDLKKAFESTDVIIVGWTHIHTNTVVPSVLAQALQKGDIDRDQIAMVVEHEPDKKAEAYAKGGPAYLGLLGNAIDLKVAVFPGDLPDRSILMKRYNMTPDQLMERRDQHFADVAYDLVTASKKKVILIVGNNHVPGIAKILRSRKVSRVTELQTKFDLVTGEVRVGDQYWGKGQTDSMLYAQDSGERLIKELGDEWRALEAAAKTGDANAIARQNAIMDRMDAVAKNFKAAHRIFENQVRPMAYRWAEEYRTRSRISVYSCMDVFSSRR